MAEKKGLWVRIIGSRSHACYCTECKHIEYGVRNAFSKEKCPNCGARMINTLVECALSWAKEMGWDRQEG